VWDRPLAVACWKPGFPNFEELLPIFNRRGFLFCHGGPF
jgi:hypothetical protein